MAPAYSWSFTTALPTPPRACARAACGPTRRSRRHGRPDTTSIELGTQFSADTDGQHHRGPLLQGAATPRASPRVPVVRRRRPPRHCTSDVRVHHRVADGNLRHAGAVHRRPTTSSRTWHRTADTRPCERPVGGPRRPAAAHRSPVPGGTLRLRWIFPGNARRPATSSTRCSCPGASPADTTPPIDLGRLGVGLGHHRDRSPGPPTSRPAAASPTARRPARSAPPPPARPVPRTR